VDGQCHAPAASSPGKEMWYPLYSRLCGALGLVMIGLEILPPLGFILWTVQPKACYFTDYTIPAAYYRPLETNIHLIIYILLC